MGSLYVNGRDQLRENGEVSIFDRTFRLVLLGAGNTRPDFDANHDDLDDVFAEDSRNDRQDDVPVRLQVIGDPSKPFGIRDRLYQFFVVEGSRDRVRRSMSGGVLYERTEEGDAPIAMLGKADVAMMVSGEGYTITVPYSAEEPEAVPRTLEFAGASTAETDKDANSVPDEEEYVDGDPDKGVRADAGVQKVQIVDAADEQPKEGTVTKENVEPKKSTSKRKKSKK